MLTATKAFPEPYTIYQYIYCLVAPYTHNLSNITIIMIFIVNTYFKTKFEKNRGNKFQKTILLRDFSVKKSPKNFYKLGPRLSEFNTTE